MATTKIILRELRLSCLIGVDAAERHARQALLLDADIALAAAPDDDAAPPPFDYAAAAERLRALAASAEFRLMESFAEAAADALLADKAAVSARVFCRKPAPFADLAAAGVEITRP